MSLAPMNAVLQSAKLVPVDWEGDVVVAGGGAAGVAAAIAAARAGANVLLVERNGFLGGTMTAATLGGICGLYSLVDERPVQMVFSFAEEVRQRLVAAGGAGRPLPWLKTASLPYDPFILRCVFDELTTHNRLTVLLHSGICGVGADGPAVTHLLLRSRGTEFAVRAGVFVDCTGDAEICALAGGPTNNAFPDLQLPSAMFRMGGVDTDRVALMKREQLHEYLEEAVAHGFDLPRTAGGIYVARPGVVHLNITKVTVDGHSPDPFSAAEMTRAERAGRQQIALYLEAFRRHVPGFESAYVLDAGSELGLRETRRIRGDYEMTTKDVLGLRSFEDAIAVNCWPIEEHGVGRSTRWVWLGPGKYNQIPVRALIPVQFRNVIAAGRCLSATHEAQASLRVTANCFSMGQAAGQLAAMATDGDVRAVDAAILRRALEQAGVVLDPKADGSS